MNTKVKSKMYETLPLIRRTNARHSWLKLGVAASLLFLNLAMAKVCAVEISKIPSALSSEAGVVSYCNDESSKKFSVRFRNGRTSFISADSAKERELLHLDGTISDIKWMDHGTSVLMLGRINGAQGRVHLFKMDVASGLTRDVTPFNRAARRFALSADGKHLYVEIALNERDEFDTFEVNLKDFSLQPKTAPAAVGWTHFVDQPMQHTESTSPVPNAAASSATTNNAHTYWRTAAKPVAVYPSGSVWPAGNQITYYTGPLPVSLKIEEFASLDSPEHKAETESRVRQIFYFAGPDEDKINRAEGLKAWNDEDKAKIESVIKSMAHSCPEIVFRASRHRKIPLFRDTAGHLGTDATLNKSYCVAYAKDSQIYLSDALLKWSSQSIEMVLFHELTHNCDLAGHISLSPEWIKLQGDRVSSLRQAVSFSKTVKGNGVDDRFAHAFGLPSLACDISVTESLAETSNPYVYNRRSLDPAVRDFFWKNVASDADNQSEEEAFRIMDLLNRDDYKAVVIAAKAALKQDPDFMFIRAMLIQAASKLHDRATTRSEASILEHQLKVLNITEAESMFCRLNYAVADAAYELGDYKKSLAILDRLLAQDKSKFLFSAKAEVQKKMAMNSHKRFSK